MHSRILPKKLIFPLLLMLVLCVSGCGAKSVQIAAGDTASTALFDYSVTGTEVLDTYPGIEIPEGQKLIRLWLVVKNTSQQSYSMFAQDFQIQWGSGDEDYTTCLDAVDGTMIPDSYALEPGKSHQGAMLVLVPQDCTEVTVAYQEMHADGSRGTAYFLEVLL